MNESSEFSPRLWWHLPRLDIISLNLEPGISTHFLGQYTVLLKTHRVEQCVMTLMFGSHIFFFFRF